MSVWHSPTELQHRGIYRDWHDTEFHQLFLELRPSLGSKPEDYKLIFLNGCFDGLHAGHISLLQYAAFNRDAAFPSWRRRIVVVAVNCDETVQELKGRVLVPFEQRLYAVSAIKGVNYVVGFAEHTPSDLIRLLPPEIIVKGPDYADCLETTPGRHYAGQVVAAPKLFDISTTKMIERLESKKRI